MKFRIFVLHSLIPKDEQENAVFLPPPEGMCHVILSSNIAESSLTIPNVRYVIDFGLRRQLVYDQRRHMSCLSTCWVSQASVKQRMGRTGRVFAGYNIRLYTRGFYENMAEFDAPEMETAPLEKLYVNVKFLAAKVTYCRGSLSAQYDSGLPDRFRVWDCVWCRLPDNSIKDFPEGFQLVEACSTRVRDAGRARDRVSNWDLDGRQT